MVYADLGPGVRVRTRVEFPPRIVRSVRLDVVAMKTGEKWKVIAISEIELLGNRGKSGAAIASLATVRAQASAVAKAPCGARDRETCGRHHLYAPEAERRAASLLGREIGVRLCEMLSCLALGEARHPGFFDDLSHPEHRRYRERLRGCADVASCLDTVDELEASSGRELAADLTQQLCLLGAAKLACSGGSARGCAALAAASLDPVHGESAHKRACELDPGACGSSASKEDATAELATLVTCCVHHESGACDLPFEALEVSYDASVEDPDALAALTPHAQPALGLSAELLLAMCAEYDLHNNRP